MTRRRITLAAMAVLAGAALAEGLRQCAADYFLDQGTLHSALLSNRLMPGRAEVYRDLAFLEPDRSMEHLRTAVRHNPADAGSWSQLALMEEAAGRYPEALHALEQAVHHDAGFAASWALCSYYFRRGEDDLFWKWAKRAAASQAADLELVAGLCWRRKPDTQTVMQVLPQNCEAHAALFRFVRDQSDDLLAAMPVARSLSSCDGSQARDLLTDFVTRTAVRQLPDAASEVWNLLSAKGRIPFPAVGGGGDLITNGAFRRFPGKYGFDWHPNAADGVSARTADSQHGGLLWTFTGTQPSTVTLLWQPVLTEPGREYRLSFTYSAAAARLERSGMHWRLTDAARGAPLVPDSPDWTDLPTATSGSEWTFRAPKSPLPLLVVYYNRPHGQTILEGAIRLSSVELRPV